MAQIGCLGEIPFTVSAACVQTIDHAVWSGAARYAEHQRHLSDALTEFTGLDADSFSFDMTLSAYLGADPLALIEQLWRYERTATTLPLIIGEKAYGKYRWVILKHKIKMQSFNRDGNLTAATVSVELLEYLKG